MKTPTNKDIWRTFGYYLAMGITGLLFVLLILSANIIAESISGWFR